MNAAPARPIRVTRATTRRCTRSATQQGAEAATHTRHLAAADHLHHPLHLDELLEQPVDLGGGRAAAERDATPPAGLDELGAAPLLQCHGVDDGLDPLHLPGVDRLLCRACHLAGARDHADELADRPHLLDLVELAAEVLEREA